MPKVNANGITIHYEMKGQGTPILFCMVVDHLGKCGNPNLKHSHHAIR